MGLATLCGAHKSMPVDTAAKFVNALYSCVHCQELQPKVKLPVVVEEHISLQVTRALMQRCSPALRRTTCMGAAK